MIRILLALSKISGIADAFIKKNVSVFKSNNIDEIINHLVKINNKITKDLIYEHLEWADRVIQRCQDLNIHILPIYHTEYPSKLKELSNPPAVLYLRGNMSLLNKNIISLIGTRKSTALANSIANKVGAHFSINNALCNGLVDGIDRHSVENGDTVFRNTIGILSGGLNFHHTSSKITSELAEKVLKEGGLLISEVEPDKKEDQFSGSKASRIQAGLSSVLILIQSSIDGGSKYTIKAFSKLNRIVGYISFTGNKEYDSDINFSANRTFDMLGLEGVAKMCDVKKNTSIYIKKLIPIHSLQDYDIIINELKKKDDNSSFLF